MAVPASTTLFLHQAFDSAKVAIADPVSTLLSCCRIKLSIAVPVST